MISSRRVDAALDRDSLVVPVVLEPFVAAGTADEEDGPTLVGDA